MENKKANPELFLFYLQSKISPSDSANIVV